MKNFKLYMLSVMLEKRKTADGYILSPVLSVLSFFYLIIAKCAYALYKNGILKRSGVGAKVISIGNITLGGTGKTPLAIKVAQRVCAMGRRPAVLTRGYGNDEAHLMQEKLGGIPVLIGRNRIKNANRAVNELGSDCIILDDGFQHYRLKRDLDIVLIDATSPFGNMRLFPRGILREPLDCLKRADIVVLTKSDMGAGNINGIRRQLEKVNANLGVAESFYKPLSFRKMNSSENLPLSHIRGKRCAVMAGIVNPGYLEWMVVNIGARINQRFYYPDHYAYSRDDIEAISRRCRDNDISVIVTTEKDAVKIERLKVKGISLDREALVLRINLKISANEEAIESGLHSVFDS